MSYVSQELIDFFYEERKWYRAEYDVDGDPDDIKTEDLNDCHYKSLRLVEDKFEELKKENETNAYALANLPNDMDEYGFDREKMRWVHCDEEEEEEEEEDFSGYEVYVEEWDDVENVLENGWYANRIRRFPEEIECADNRARQYYDELVAQMADHLEWKAVMCMKYGENGDGDVICETHQDIRQQQKEEEP